MYETTLALKWCRDFRTDVDKNWAPNFGLSSFIWPNSEGGSHAVQWELLKCVELSSFHMFPKHRKTLLANWVQNFWHLLKLFVRKRNWSATCEKVSRLIRKHMETLETECLIYSSAFGGKASQSSELLSPPQILQRRFLQGSFRLLLISLEVATAGEIRHKISFEIIWTIASISRKTCATLSRP